MAIYSFRTAKSEAVNKWLLETKERSKENNFLKNPFKLRFKKIVQKESWIIVVEMTPVFANISFIWWMMAFGIFFLWGLTPLILVPAIAGLSGIFWTSDFYFFMNKQALKKSGYKAKIQRLKLADLISEVVL